MGWIDAEVKKFDITKIVHKTKIPHMGWNSIDLIDRDNPIFIGIENKNRFYFLHSFYIECKNNCDVIATSNYGYKFSSAINSGNIFGVQFHPEKSLKNGEKLLVNFSKI